MSVGLLRELHYDSFEACVNAQGYGALANDMSCHPRGTMILLGCQLAYDSFEAASMLRAVVRRYVVCICQFQPADGCELLGCRQVSIDCSAALRCIRLASPAAVRLRGLVSRWSMNLRQLQVAATASCPAVSGLPGTA